MSLFPKKIMIVTSFPPEGGFGGGVILRSLLSKDIKNDVTWVNLNYTRNETCRTTAQGWHYYPTPIIIRGYTYLGKLGNRWLKWKVQSFIKRLNQAHKPDIIWMVLDYQIAEQLSYLALIKFHHLHVSIHDDPRVVVSNNAYKYHTPERMQKWCAKVLKQADSIDCISDRMTAYIKSEVKHENVVTITRALCDGKWKKPDIAFLDLINIVMGGFGEMPPPWPHNLMNALILLEQKMGKPVVFHAFDNSLKPHANDRLKVYELMPENRFDEFMASMHIGYACDPFETEAELAFAKTSMSTKVLTYIGHGLPVFYHGPADSTVGDLITKYDIGCICESNDSVEIVTVLGKIINKYEHYTEKEKDVIDEVFNLNVLQQKLIKLWNPK